MTLPALAHTIFIGDAVPDTTAASPRLKSGIANLVDTPGATGLLTNSGAPAGTLITNTGRSAMATQTYVTALTTAAEKGTPWTAVSTFIPTAGKNTAQTIPVAPTGTFAQSGVAAVTNVTAVTLS